MKKYEFLASIDIDSQQCFTPLCPDELPVEDGQNIVDELNSQAKLAKLRVGTKDAHSPHALWIPENKTRIFNLIEPELTNKHKNIDLYWPEHAVPGTKGFDLIPGLPRPAEYDYFVWKGIEVDMHPYGACYHDIAETLSTGLIEYLKVHNITHIIAGGLALDYCVKTTVLQLLNANFKVILNLAATKGLAQETSKFAKQEMIAKGAYLIDNSQNLSNIINNI